MKWGFLDDVDFKIKTTNTSFPLLLNDDLVWHNLQLDALLTPTQTSVWWFLLHVMENEPNSDHHIDIIARVCFDCLLCHDIQVNVEVLQPGKNESIVCNINDYTLVNSANNRRNYLQNECVTGITCTTCNIILTYKSSPPQNQTEECGCEFAKLSVLVKNYKEGRKLTSVTSVKGKRISKTSKR